MPQSDVGSSQLFLVPSTGMQTYHQYMLHRKEFLRYVSDTTQRHLRFFVRTDCHPRVHARKGHLTGCFLSGTQLSPSMRLAGHLRALRAWCEQRQKQFLRLVGENPTCSVPTLLLRGTILNRTYGTNEKTCIFREFYQQYLVLSTRAPCNRMRGSMVVRV